MKQNYSHGVILCLIATLSWGIMFPVMTSALHNIDPFTFTLLRYTIAGIVFVAVGYNKEGGKLFSVNGKHLLLWIFGSAGFAGFGFLVFLGQQQAGKSGALTASIMMATMPMLSLLVNWGLKKSRPPLWSFVFILLSFSGVLLVISKGDLSALVTAPQNYSANALIILGALCWVIYTTGGTYFPQFSPIKYTALTTLYGLITIYIINIFLISNAIIPLPTITQVVSIIPELIYMALIAGFVGVLCWNAGNKIITPINGVLFMDIVPITAFTISTMQGVIPTNAQIVGIICTASALVFNNLYQRKRLKRLMQP